MNESCGDSSESLRPWTWERRWQRRRDWMFSYSVSCKTPPRLCCSPDRCSGPGSADLHRGHSGGFNKVQRLSFDSNITDGTLDSVWPPVHSQAFPPATEVLCGWSQTTKTYLVSFVKQVWMMKNTEEASQTRMYYAVWSETKSANRSDICGRGWWTGFGEAVCEPLLNDSRRNVWNELVYARLKLKSNQTTLCTLCISHDANAKHHGPPNQSSGLSRVPWRTLHILLQEHLPSFL